MSSQVDVLLRGLNYEDAEVTLRSLLGSILQADWRQALIARGFGWHWDSVAAFATPILGGGAGTVLDLDQPEFGISVPLGYTMVPLRIAIEAGVGISTTDGDVYEAAVLLDRTAAWAGDGTVTTEVARNMRTDIVAACPLSGFSAATADITDPVLSAILASKLLAANFGDATGISVDSVSLVYEPVNPLFVVGPGAIYCYAGGTRASSCYVTATVLAFPSSLVTGLS